MARKAQGNGNEMDPSGQSPSLTPFQLGNYFTKGSGCEIPGDAPDPAARRHRPAQTSCHPEMLQVNHSRPLSPPRLAERSGLDGDGLGAGPCLLPPERRLRPGVGRDTRTRAPGWRDRLLRDHPLLLHLPRGVDGLGRDLDLHLPRGVEGLDRELDTGRGSNHLSLGGGCVHAEFKGRARYLGDLQRDCSLRVLGLRPSDRGTYRFRFYAVSAVKNDTWRSKAGQRLRVSDDLCQPSLGRRMQPGPSLTCSVQATCPHHPSWYDRDGERRSPGETPGRSGATELRISPSQLHPGMALRCQVDGYRDECDSDQSQPLGTVARNVPRVEVSWLAGKAALREGDGFTLRCQAAALWPVPEYVWSHGDVWLPEAGQDLRVEKAAVSDGGSYACGVWVSGPGWGYLSLSARESVEVQHAPTGVRVTAAPGSSPQEGESVTLTCSYTSSLPTPNSYTWYRGGRQLEGSRQEMVLKNMTAEQAGEYRCQADNGIGQSPSPPITITVLYAPTGVRVSAAPGTSPQAGESVTLTCNYTSSLPAPNSYTWYQGGRQLEGSRQEMVLKNMTAEQAGEYRCQADNGIGQSPSPPINITVLSTPRVWAPAYILGPAVALVLLLLVGLVGVTAWRKRRSKRQGLSSDPDQPGPGETPMSERIYENTQHYGMGKPARLAPPRAPSAPTEVFPGSPDGTGQSHIYSQPMKMGRVLQSDPDEVHYSAIQLQHPTRRAEPAADLTCEYAVIKR
ncbi:B-cell receptor CD22-like isoform X9 [Chelonia mydas]|uniref:B-cell receptor CD22-like isoform X9 n=1 Tax=Chelonia mydas TaxID=8469 RepID=UPI001CA8FD65|nr:B-cell receptor CD22-like isoform X9 [Chelonia mydas]